jgi:outer membrane protein OmpA-like peptidoglycan-associated protein
MNAAKSLVTATLVVALGACATDDPNQRAKTGAAIGAVAGAVAGHQFGQGQGRWAGSAVGAVVGAVAGGAVGHYMDKQQAELKQKLAAEEQAKLLQITKLSDDSLKIGIAADASFDVGKADLRGEALNTFTKIAGVLKEYDKTVIHVVGHTDSDGSDQYNQTLSENRASSVNTVLAGQGVPGERLRQEGRGEREPAASNATADGKRRNRRVDIVIKAVVEGNEAAAWTPPPYLGS